MNTNPYSIVSDFEERLAEWSGSSYCVATDSCTSAIFLSLQYRKTQFGFIGEVTIPSHTYPSTACSILHCGGKIKFSNERWEGVYELEPLSIIDGALRFRKNMYEYGLHALSFHAKKRLNIGRGGAILTNDINARDWLRRARFDGRRAIPLLEDDLTMLGWNCYLTPEQAARGIQLFELLRNREDLFDLPASEQKYADLSKFPIYQQ